MGHPIFLVIEPSAEGPPWFPSEVSWADTAHHGECLVIDARGFAPWASRRSTYYDFHSIVPQELERFGTKPVAAGRVAQAAFANKRLYSLRPERDSELLDILLLDTIGERGIVTVSNAEELFLDTLSEKGYASDKCIAILSDLKANLGASTWRRQDVHELHGLVDLWAAIVGVPSAPN
jgi:hypothetical protein